MGPYQPRPHSLWLLAAWTHEGNQQCLFAQTFVLLCRLTFTKDFHQPCSTLRELPRISLITSTTTTKARSGGLFATWRKGLGPAWRSWVGPLREGGFELFCDPGLNLWFGCKNAIKHHILSTHNQFSSSTCQKFGSTIWNMVLFPYFGILGGGSPKSITYRLTLRTFRGGPVGIL